MSSLSPALAFGVHDNNTKNFVRGVSERVFAVESQGELVPPPRPNPGHFEEVMGHFRRQYGHGVVVTTPWSHDEFVATYEGRRATIYQAAVESLRTEPVNRRDAFSSSFLKAEKIGFYLKGDPAPRLIHPRDPRYNVEVGVFLKKIEHDVYRNVDRVWGGPTILKGYNARQVGGIMHDKWSSFKKPVAIGLDASRFDQHVSVDALRFEHSVYLQHFAGIDRNRLRMLLGWQLRTPCFGRASDGRVKYTVEGMRFSGDMNTGMGNCLLMSGMVWSWAKHCGVDVKLANNGDDCTVILEQTDMARFLEGMCDWFRGLGFTMKVEQPVYDMERIEFCQTHPIWTPEGWVMVRGSGSEGHRHTMAKDCISIKPLDNRKVYDKWRMAVSQAGLALTGGVPVYQEFYTALGRGAKGEALKNDLTLETGFMRLARGMDRRYQQVHPRTRYSFWLAFGSTPDQQEAVESHLRTVSPTWTVPEYGYFPEQSALTL